MESTRRATLFPILLVTFVGTLSFSIGIPLLVVLVTDFGGNAIIYGVIGATYSAFQLVGAPILGRWSDKYGRKRILLVSHAGTLIAWVIFLAALFLPTTALFESESAALGKFALTIPLLVIFMARALDGFTGGNVSVAHAYLADITTKEERSKNFGRLGVAQNLGFTIGPALAGILGATALGATLPVLAALVISAIVLPIIFFRVKESRPPRADEGSHAVDEGRAATPGKKMTPREILRIENIPYLLVVYFAMFLGFNIFYTAFPIHAIQALEWSIVQMGIFFAFLSSIGVLVQGPVLARVSKRYSDATLCIFGNAVLGTSFVLLLSVNIVVLFIAVALFSIGTGLMWPSFLSILSKQAGEAHQGAVQGLASSSGSLASIFGLILGGFLYVLLGPMTFLVSAAMIFVTFLLSFRFTSFRTKASSDAGTASTGA